MTKADQYCETRADGECISTDPRCMHQLGDKAYLDGRLVMDTKQELADDNQRLRALLKKYGRHALDCDRPRKPDCSCGWDAISDDL